MIHQNQLAAQMYSFRDFIKTPEGVDETFRKLKDMGYESVQLSSSIAKMPEEKLLDLLKKNGLTACSSHEAGGDYVDHIEAVAEHLNKLNCSHTAYPFPALPRGNRMEVLAMARLLNDRAQYLKTRGITLSYHNHSLEFEKLEGRTILELLYENAPDLEAELDTYWVQHGGANPVKWISAMKNRMQVLHLKDYGNSQCNALMKPIGEGNLDWDEIFSAAETTGVRYYVVEHDSCPEMSPFDSFAISAGFILNHYVR